MRRKRVTFKSLVLNLVGPLLLITGVTEKMLALDRGVGKSVAPSTSWSSPAPGLAAVRGRQFPPPSRRMEGYLPNIVLRTQDNQPVRFYDDLIKGKVVMINFMYASCNGT
jgi:hypothetical protein